MKDKTNFFKKFITSIYDLRVFSKYAKEGLLSAIIYILLLTLILGGIKGIFTGCMLNNQISRIYQELNSDKYRLSIENGILNINESPVKFEEKNGIVYIDKDISINEVKSLRSITVNEDLSILFLKDGIVVKNSMDEYKIFYDMLNELTFFGVPVTNDINVFQITIFVLVMIIVIITTFLLLLINCLIVVAFASLATIFMKMVVKYSAMYSLTLYAATLPLIIQTILGIINPNIDFDTIFIIGTLLYVILILNYIKTEIIENLNKIKH